MKKILLNKAKTITTEMNQLECKHLYWLREDWQKLYAQLQLVNELLRFYLQKIPGAIESIDSFKNALNVATK
jgi:hypothetical protein